MVPPLRGVFAEALTSGTNPCRPHEALGGLRWDFQVAGASSGKPVSMDHGNQETILGSRGLLGQINSGFSHSQANMRQGGVPPTRSTPDPDYHVVLILSGHSNSARHRAGNPLTTTNPQDGKPAAAPAKQRGNHPRVVSRAAGVRRPIAGGPREEPCMQDEPTSRLWLQWSRLFRS